MPYNKVSNKSQDKDVKYLNKDFQSFKNKLQEFAEIYFLSTTATLGGVSRSSQNKEYNSTYS